MIELTVGLDSRSYSINIGHGAIGMLADLVAPHARSRMMLVSSRRVWSLHRAKVERPLRRLGKLTPVIIPDGERHKSRATLAGVQDAFVEAGLGRDGLVIAFGGGMVGDLTGFAAATYMRGVSWVQLPTTLLAMVDSSVGGKVGINHPRGKNLIGAFHQPRTVITDPALLETLPARELQSGAYEVLKCGILADRTLFDAIRLAPAGLAGWDRVEMEGAIAGACRIKAEIVERDEREDGLRRVLNLGHTLGHALEAVTGYRRFTHGEAVGWGLIGAAWIAHRMGRLPESGFDAIASAVDSLGPRPRVSDLKPQLVMAALAHDKKAVGGKVPFILPSAIGRVVIEPEVDPALIRHALRVMAAHEARDV